MRRLTTLFPSEFLEEHAEELGVVERDRKLQIPAFRLGVQFGFAAGESRTLAGFRRSYNSTADETISPSGFYQWLTPTLAEYFRDLVERGLDEVAVSDAVDADTDRFRDVMVADGTVLRLHEFLSDRSKPAMRSRLERSSTCSTMPQSRRSNESILLTRKHTTAPCSKQGHGLRTASCCSIRLLQVPPVCADRRERRLLREPAETEREPGDYGRITEWRGRAIPLEGKQPELFSTIRSEVHRCGGRSRVQAGPYNGTQSLDTKRFRVVGVRDEDADDYHLYMTNLARKEFFPADLAEIYRCRWKLSCCSGS